MLPVVFGIDKSHILQMFVVIHSILRNSEGKIHFIVLTKDRMEEEVAELSEMLSEKYDNFVLSLRKIEEAFDDVKIHNWRLSIATYFRLLIPEFVREYDKCIYLDSDVLVNGDLQILFQTNIDNYDIAGVRDIHYNSGGEDWISAHQMKIGMFSTKNYVNAGVLLMNLKKMRGDDMTAKFLEQAKKDNPLQDQDVINICCQGKVKILPVNYNLFHLYMGSAMKYLLGSIFSREEFTFDWNRPFILHMIGKYKPWLNRKYKGAEQWWEVAEIYRASQAYQNMQKRCGLAEDEIKDAAHVLEVCACRGPVILWGFTEQGKDVCEIFARRGICVFAFCDNDEKKQTETYRGIPVMAYSTAERMTKDAIWVITCRNDNVYREIYGQLRKSGVVSENIFRFTCNNRDRKDYLALDSRYYKEEEKIIALCENDRKQMDDEQYLRYIHRIIEKADINDERYRYLYSKYRFDLWLKG